MVNNAPQADKILYYLREPPGAQLIAYYLREPPRNIASGIILAVHGSTGPPIYQIGVRAPDAQMGPRVHE